MTLSLEILKNTPAWVFVLLAFLVWQGMQATRTRITRVWRLMIIPIAFIALGLSKVVLARADGFWPPVAWLAAACVLAGFGFATGPRLLAVDRVHRRVTRPGSIVPLLRNLLVFGLQYGVAIQTALHPDIHSAAAAVGCAISGATAGYFVGWALALRQQYHAAATQGSQRDQVGYAL